MTDRISVVESSPSTRFTLEADLIDQDVVTNKSTIRMYFRCNNGPSGNTSSSFLGPGSHAIAVDGIWGGAAHSPNPFLPAGYAQNAQRWRFGPYDIEVQHDSDGYAPNGSYPTLRMGYFYGGIDQSHVYGYYLPRIARPPDAPNTPSSSSVTTTSMTLSWNLPDANGGTLSEMLLRRWTNADLSGAYVDYTNSGSTTSRNVTGLTPGTIYYWAVYAENEAGYSPRSGVKTQATLPATAPGISVAPSLNGQQALVTLSPPGGVSGVTEYNIEYRPVGGSTVATSTTTTSKLVTGLTPGQSYEWRANAEIGGYTSPWSSWLLIAQPNPNTNPGDYFDGSTTARPDTTYSWLGTTNNSTSRATGVGVTGWGSEFTSPAAGVMHRITGGHSGAFSARVQFTRDTTAASQWRAGGSTVLADRVPVEELTTYTASIYVNPQGRSQRMAARITWYNSGGGVISAVVGDGIVAAADGWTRLWITTASPAGAETAIIRATDVSGTSFSLFLSGQSVLLDSAMITLGSELLPWFDGNTVDTAQFLYGWVGAADSSASTRTQLMAITDDPLVDPDCVLMPAPPLPPVIPSDCIDEVGEWRRYTVQILDSDVPLWGSILPTLVLDTDESAERQVRIRFFPNYDGVAPELVDTTIWQAELILTYIPPNTELTLDGVSQRVWAEVSGGEPVAGDQLLYGTGGVPATWPELTCGVGYVITLDVPLEAPAGNLSTRVLLTQRV